MKGSIRATFAWPAMIRQKKKALGAARGPRPRPMNQKPVGGPEGKAAQQNRVNSAILRDAPPTG